MSQLAFYSHQFCGERLKQKKKGLLQGVLMMERENKESESREQEGGEDGRQLMAKYCRTSLRMWTRCQNISSQPDSKAKDTFRRSLLEGIHSIAPVHTKSDRNSCAKSDRCMHTLKNKVHPTYIAQASNFTWHVFLLKLRRCCQLKSRACTLFA